MKDIIIKFGNVNLSDCFSFLTRSWDNCIKLEGHPTEPDELIEVKVHISCPTSVDRNYAKKILVPQVKDFFLKKRNDKCLGRWGNTPKIYYAGKD